MLTVPQAARIVGRDPETVRRWIRSGKLRARSLMLVVDASVALAQLLRCRLVTLDRRLRRAADRLGLVVGPDEL